MKKVILSIATIALLTSCGGEEKKEVSNIDPTKKETQQIKTSVSGTFNVVADSTSNLTWTGSAIGKSHYGTVDYKGSLTVKEGQIIGGNLVFDMATIDTQDQEGKMKDYLDGHLKNHEFFHVDSFPTSKLVIKGFDGENLKGDLTIKDVTKSISFPATVTITESSIQGSAEFSIDRTEYGITHNAKGFMEVAKDKLINNEVSFKVKINAFK